MLQAKLSSGAAEEAERKAAEAVHGKEGCDGIARFSEVDAARGSLGRFPGSEVMPIIKSYLA